MKIFRLIFRLAACLIKAILLFFEGIFWIGYVIRQMILFGIDAIGLIGSSAPHSLYCPKGHEIILEGGVYQCEACNYVYEGNILQCPNCGAVTPYINCHCGLSVKNPYRMNH